jgi:hypothetical protein
VIVSWIGTTNGLLILLIITPWACLLATGLRAATGKVASMINEPPEYNSPPALKSAPKTGLLGLVTQSTGICRFCTKPLGTHTYFALVV